MQIRYFVTGALAIMLSTPVWGATFQCWTNSDGVRECGSVIPPEYVKQEHEVRGADGQVVKTVEAEKSPEERQAIMEQQRREDEERERKKRQEEADKRLLDAYPTESDIDLAREGKLASVDAAIHVAKNQVAFFQRGYDEARKNLERQPEGKTREELLKHIENLQEQIDKFNGIIAEKEQEKKAIRQEHDEYLKRHREIKARIEAIQNQRLRRQQPASPPPEEY
jgi:hypothetical protein